MQIVILPNVENVWKIYFSNIIKQNFIDKKKENFKLISIIMNEKYKIGNIASYLKRFS